MGMTEIKATTMMLPTSLRWLDTLSLSGLEALAGDPGTSQDVLAMLANSDDLSVTLVAAANPRTPDAALAWLIEGALDVLREPWLASDLLARLARHPDPEVRWLTARRPELGAQDRAALLCDPDPEVRAAAGRGLTPAA